jgi:hypothetical protein
MTIRLDLQSMPSDWLKPPSPKQILAKNRAAITAKHRMVWLNRQQESKQMKASQSTTQQIKKLDEEIAALMRKRKPATDDGVLNPGERLRVPMSAMDGKPPKVEKLADGKQVLSHRAGWRVKGSLSTDSFHNERAKVYDEYTDYISNAWKGDAVEPQGPTGFGSASASELRGDKIGDPCTCRGANNANDFGSPGTMQMVGGKLVCVPTNPRNADAKSVYDKYNEDISNAWKGEDAKKRKVQYRDPEGRETGTAEEQVEDAKRLKDHKATMAALYADRDRELESAWKTAK